MITQNQFCYWDCKSDPDAIILIINSIFTLIIVILAIRYCYQYHNIHTTTTNTTTK